MRIAAARIVFAEAVRRSLARSNIARDLSAAAALVVPHRPQRDEDNTWATWSAALSGTRTHAPTHVGAGAPLAGWTRMAIASIAGPTLETPVLYELWA